MKITQVSDTVTPSLNRIQRDIQNLPEQAFKEYVRLTPVRSGNARRKTRLQGTDTIAARYPYARPLDQGWSRQAPQGMSAPVFEYIRRLLRRIMRK